MSLAQPSYLLASAGAELLTVFGLVATGLFAVALLVALILCPFWISGILRETRHIRRLLEHWDRDA